MFIPKTLILFIVLLCLSNAAAKENQENHSAADTQKLTLETVDCWYGAGDKGWPTQECFDMHVPEDHDQPDGRKITFPVLIFRNPNPVKDKAPLIHLGAGGPGATMYLDSGFSVGVIFDESRKLWLDQGRDFIVIDPRGSGLAKPLLTCDLFVENVVANLQQNLSLQEAYDKEEQDYLNCIKRFQDEGIHLRFYNSLSVARDVEMLRKALEIKQWILYGISHAATYAQLVANDYPDTVTNMILDSATFPNLKPHHTFPEYTLATYEALYNYCEKSADCDTPMKNTKERFWQLYTKLTETPLKIDVPHPNHLNETIPVLLNGNLFVQTMLYGLYGKEIFDKIPAIIAGLEDDNADALLDDISWYLAYLLDDKYGDVSAIAHHCYDTIPFTDHQLIAEKSLQLPAGYIRDSALLAEDWRNICKYLEMDKSDPKVAKASKTSIPTLFLHGKFDTITPLKHVREQRAGFTNSQLLVYPLSHGVLGIDKCADDAAAAFLLDAAADLDKISCE